MALGGKPGEEVESLLHAAIRDGSDVLADLAREAVARLIRLFGTAAVASGSLFLPDELDRLAEILAATLGTADMLGRALIRDFAQREGVVESRTGGRVLPVPVKLQDTAYSCGAACLVAVCKYHGVDPTDEWDAIRQLGTSRRTGTPPDAIVQLATAAGLDVEIRTGLSVDDLADATVAGAPVICPIQRHGTPEEEASDMAGHYVVVTGVDDGVVHFMDPVTGVDTMSAREWDRRWHDVEADGAPCARLGIAIGRCKHPVEPSLLFEAVTAPVDPLPPERAVRYFTSLVPAVGRDPVRYGAEKRRDAFTLAKATSVQLLGRVQDAIRLRIETGAGISEAPHDIEAVLDAAGVSRSNPQYAEMVFRTNAMDAYTTAAEEERMAPDMLAAFPVWRYLGIDDTRAGEDHRPHFGNYYPASVAFHDVRGERVYNCRCSPQAISRRQWAGLKAAGAKIADGYPDVPAIGEAPVPSG